MMELPKNAVVAVADGEKLSLFKNSGDAGSPKLTSMTSAAVGAHNAGSGSRHQSSSANPSDSQQDEDGFAAGVADMLNKQALEGKFDHLVIIAAPRTLGELRKHYQKALSAALVGEIAKDLTGHQVDAIEKAISAA
jgi:protein required for attachment to host cells